MCDKIIKNIIGDKHSKNFSQMKYGIKTEMEHAKTFKFIKNYEDKTGRFPADKVIAKHIAGDHLKEKSNYYSIVKKQKL